MPSRALSNEAMAARSNARRGSLGEVDDWRINRAWSAAFAKLRRTNREARFERLWIAVPTDTLGNVTHVAAKSSFLEAWKGLKPHFLAWSDKLRSSRYRATPDPGFRIPNKGPVSGIAPALPGCTLKTGSVPSRANVNEDKKCAQLLRALLLRTLRKPIRHARVLPWITHRSAAVLSQRGRASGKLGAHSPARN